MPMDEVRLAEMGGGVLQIQAGHHLRHLANFEDAEDGKAKELGSRKDRNSCKLPLKC